MNRTAQAPSAPGSGSLHTSAELLPELYNHLRRLAASRLSREHFGQTLEARALVHEAWLRITGLHDHPWQSRGEFCCAASLAMRRILAETARRRRRREMLEGGARVPLDYVQVVTPLPNDEWMALEEGLRTLEHHHPQAAHLVDLRFFAGFKQSEAAEQLGVSRSTADRLWLLARSWLQAHIRVPAEGRPIRLRSALRRKKSAGHKCR